MPTPPSFETISDDQLLAGVRKLVVRTNTTLADLLAHLGEVEARGIHRQRACATLYTYCIYELRMSEDAAYRRSKAARLVRQFPELFERIATGELHLTGLLLLGPHLDSDRRLEILERARFRSKREIEKLVARIDPKPEVPARVEPIGPAPAAPETLPGVEPIGWILRTLPVGDRPADWSETEPDAASPASEFTPACENAPRAPLPELPPVRFKVQFTATQDYVDAMNEALDLLSHELCTRDIVEVHARAMKALLTELRRTKRAATDRPRPVSPARARSATVQPPSAAPPATDHPPPAPARPLPTADRPQSATDHSPPTADQPQPPHDEAKRTRYITAQVRREVWTRDGGRCAYVDDHGRRCAETARLEIHHRLAHGNGGSRDAENLELRCRAHNDLAAEQDFGREHMAWMRGQLTAEDPRRRVSAEHTRR